jgi:hypothetical protein
MRCRSPGACALPALVANGAKVGAGPGAVIQSIGFGADFDGVMTAVKAKDPNFSDDDHRTADCIVCSRNVSLL